MNKELKEFLARNFEVVHSSSSEELTDQLEYLKELLSERIKFFIRTDIEKLMQALYRIDVSDKLTDEAFDLGDIDKVARSLSESIIDRQIKKIEYSKEHRGD